MTKRDYKLIAYALNATKPLIERGKPFIQWERTVAYLTNEIKRNDERFDPERFLATCYGI